MDKNQQTRTVKKKFLTADKVGKKVKAVGKPVLMAGAALGALVLKEALTSKDNDENG